MATSNYPSSPSITIYQKENGSTNNWVEIKTLSMKSSYSRKNISISDDTLAVKCANNLIIYYKDQGGTNDWGLVKTISLPFSPESKNDGGNNINLTMDGDNIAAYGWTNKAFIFSKDQGGTNNWGLQDTITAAPKYAGGYSYVCNDR